MYYGTYDNDGTSDAAGGRQAELTRVRNAVENEFRRGPFCVGLDAPLKEAHRIATAATRAQELSTVCQFGCMLYLAAVLLLNLFARAAPVWSEVAAQCTITPFVALSIAHVAFRPKNPVLLREAGAFAVAACFSVASLWAVCAHYGAMTVLNLFPVSLAVIAAVFFVHLRFAAALALVGLMAFALWLTLLVRADVPDALRAYPLGFLLAVSAPALFSVHQRERAARNLYLTGLLQDLRIAQLAFENSLLSRLSTTDPLTGAANRRHLEHALRTLCATPPNGDFLLLADIDFFKRFNDQHGHVAGDACLRAVVGAIRRQLRRSDLVARFGGEEFAVVLPATTLPDALATAERIRAGVAKQCVKVDGRPETVTVSIGISERSGGMTPSALITLADDALYAAKREGRNRVRSAARAPQDVAA